jgi:hypothetical protein
MEHLKNLGAGLALIAGLAAVLYLVVQPWFARPVIAVALVILVYNLGVVVRLAIADFRKRR